MAVYVTEKRLLPGVDHLHRAAGVLREQARFMVRCGFDVFAPADGASPDDWTHVVNRFRHVYQRAEDGREPAFEERRA